MMLMQVTRQYRHSLPYVYNPWLKRPLNMNTCEMTLMLVSFEQNIMNYT